MLWTMENMNDKEEEKVGTEEHNEGVGVQEDTKQEDQHTKQEEEKTDVMSEDTFKELMTSAGVVHE